MRILILLLLLTSSAFAQPLIETNNITTRANFRCVTVASGWYVWRGNKIQVTINRRRGYIQMSCRANPVIFMYLRKSTYCIGDIKRYSYI